MNQKTVKMAAIYEIETKGKTEKEVLDLISKAIDKEKADFEKQSLHEYLDNGKTKLPEIRKMFEKQIVICVEKVGIGTKPEFLPVVGYNPKSSVYIVCKSGEADDGSEILKLHTVGEELVISSSKKLDEVNAASAAKREQTLAAAKAKRDAKKAADAKKTTEAKKA